MTRDELKKIIAHFGGDVQILKTIEELGELQKPLLKYLETGTLNIDNITEEIADCLIMITQLQIMFRIEEDDVLDIMDKKIKRTLEIVDKDNNIEYKGHTIFQVSDIVIMKNTKNGNLYIADRLKDNHILNKNELLEILKERLKNESNEY